MLRPSYSSLQIYTNQAIHSQYASPSFLFFFLFLFILFVFYVIRFLFRDQEYEIKIDWVLSKNYNLCCFLSFFKNDKNNKISLGYYLGYTK